MAFSLQSWSTSGFRAKGAGVRVYSGSGNSRQIVRLWMCASSPPRQPGACLALRNRAPCRKHAGSAEHRIGPLPLRCSFASDFAFSHACVTNQHETKGKGYETRHLLLFIGLMTEG